MRPTGKIRPLANGRVCYDAAQVGYGASTAVRAKEAAAVGLWGRKHRCVLEEAAAGLAVSRWAAVCCCWSGKAEHVLRVSAFPQWRAYYYYYYYYYYHYYYYDYYYYYFYFYY